MRFATAVPLYVQVEEALAAAIDRGEFVAGDQLPTEDGLIEQFKVSRITARHAVGNLVARGLAETRRGRGTYVAAARIVQPLTELTGFVEDMLAAGLEASAHVVSTGTETATGVVADQLNMPLGKPVTFIERVRLANGRPVSFDQTYLAADIGSLVAGDDLENEPIFTLLEQKYGIPLIEATYRLEAVGATAHVAAALDTDEASPIFLIERTSFTTGHRPVDYERLHYRGDAIAFVTHLQRKPTNQ